MRNPYEQLDPSKFWKTGVNNLKPGSLFENLWNPKFKIEKNSKILTSGSCFAQHISKWLSENGYNWVEAEVPPEAMSDSDKKANGYGVFSFRTGNIYTPALLRQWIFMALNHHSPLHEISFENDRYYDLLRPGIPMNGYDSKDDLYQSRKKTLASIKNAILNSDIFIFTMGLTEGWRSNEGITYPSCPGTIRGVFNNIKHHFHNYNYDEVLGDMEWILKEIKYLNPDMKFLLTVSPVPLTATASDNHILSATAFSKAVLRSVAGELSSRFDYVDYFPSYEIISSVTSKTNYYEKNFRTVKKEGVQFVMNHFNFSLQQRIRAENVIENKTSHQDIDEICDDILLEKWAPSNKDDTDSNICLIGDSHMGLLSNALNKLKKKHFGGMIMNGSAWTSNLIHLDADDLFVPLENKEARHRWDQIWPIIKAKGKELWLITNIGMQTHRSVSLYINHLNSKKIKTITDEGFREYFSAENSKKILILKELISLGVRVLVVSDPPTRHLDEEISKVQDFWKYYDAQSLKILHEIGCSTVNAGVHFSGDNFKEEYYSKTVFADGTLDWYHGSEIYYEDLSKLICNNILERN